MTSKLDPCLPLEYLVLEPAEIKLWLTIRSFGNGELDVFASRAEVAKRAGYGPKYARDVVRQLVEKGAMRAPPKHRRGQILWRLLEPRLLAPKRNDDSELCNRLRHLSQR